MTVGVDRRGERFLVTGAGGFIGRHLVARLRDEGAEVTALTRASVDLTDRTAVVAAVTAAAPDTVLHLAASRVAGTLVEREATTTVNTLTGAWITEAVPDTCRALVRLGSSTEYAAADGPMDEDTPLRPRGWFGATKAAGSLLFLATAAERGLRARVLRAFQVYGPHDKPARLVPTLLAGARHGTTVPLTAPGQRRDWIWVGDVVEACLLAAEADLPGGTVHNIGTGVQTANEDVARLVERATGRSVAVAVGQHPGRAWDTGDWVCDPTAARRDLGWEPEVELLDGLTRCWTAQS